jgi:hypothetical protein
VTVRRLETWRATEITLTYFTRTGSRRASVRSIFGDEQVSHCQRVNRAVRELRAALNEAVGPCPPCGGTGAMTLGERCVGVVEFLSLLGTSMGPDMDPWLDAIGDDQDMWFCLNRDDGVGAVNAMRASAARCFDPVPRRVEVALGVLARSVRPLPGEAL